MSPQLTEVTGSRGESILELCLTNYEAFSRPLFRLGFLGEKWPTVDFYVELLAVRKKRPYFLAQAKATSAKLPRTSLALKINVKKRDVVRLKQIPGPTYVFGIHEPSQKVFVRAVLSSSPNRGISKIPVTHELTPNRLRTLHDEVRSFWKTTGHKPTTSTFS